MEIGSNVKINILYHSPCINKIILAVAWPDVFDPWHTIIVRYVVYLRFQFPDSFGLVSFLAWAAAKANDFIYLQIRGLLQGRPSQVLRCRQGWLASSNRSHPSPRKGRSCNCSNQAKIFLVQYTMVLSIEFDKCSNYIKDRMMVYVSLGHPHTYFPFASSIFSSLVTSSHLLVEYANSIRPTVPYDNTESRKVYSTFIGFVG